MQTAWATADSAPAAPAAGRSGALPEGNRFEQQKGRRMTYTAELSLQVDNLPDVLRKAEELVKAAGGYVQESGRQRRHSAHPGREGR